MDKEKPTLAIYGIQDRKDLDYPLMVHDHNLALMHNGRVRYFLQQERISHRKRDCSLHIDLKSILKGKKLLAADYDLVFVDNVVGRTFLTRDGEVRFEAPLNTRLSDGLEKGRCWWFGQEREGYVLNHEMAHMFSCLPFFGPFRENSLLVHFDGGASLSNFSAALFRNGKFRWIESHWDLKPMSSIYNVNALVFSILGAKLPGQNSVPGKFMGFAGWGSYQPEIEEWLVAHQYFQDIWGKTAVFFQRVKKDFGIELRSFDQKNPFLQDVAATLQHIFVKNVLKKIFRLANETGARNLYYTGGSALNIVANSQIIENGIFENVFIPPCCDDSGLALGAAAFAEWTKHGEVKIHAPYLNNWGIEEGVTRHSFETVQAVALMLVEGDIIGVCNGFGEAGPRALGNRSLLALADSKKRARKLSMEKKGREWYRPLAPVALVRNTKYFSGQQDIHPLSKYMLIEFPVLPEHRKEIAGALHVDGTARFQTIFERKENPFIYDLLELLERDYGVRALINTSFNTQGMPIVHTSRDAHVAAKEMHLDALILDGKRVAVF